MILSFVTGATRKREYESPGQLIRYWCCSAGFRTGLQTGIPWMLSKARREIRNGNRRVPENAVKVASSWAFVLSSDKDYASWSIRRSAKGLARLRPRFPAIITVAWRELETTVANKRNGNQMQIWLPFVFYTPSICRNCMFLFGYWLKMPITAFFFWPIASKELSMVFILSIKALLFVRRGVSSLIFWTIRNYEICWLIDW